MGSVEDAQGAGVDLGIKKVPQFQQCVDDNGGGQARVEILSPHSPCTSGGGIGSRGRRV